MSTSVTIHLSDDERAHVQTVVHRGRINARTLMRAHVLLKLDAGWRDTAIRDAFGVGATTIWRVRQRYAVGGLDAVLDAALHDRRRARRRAALSGERLAHLVAIACSDALAGHDHWTLRLLAGKAMELGYVERISPETIRALLKKRAAALASSGVAPPGDERGVRLSHGRHPRHLRHPGYRRDAVGVSG